MVQEQTNEKSILIVDDKPANLQIIADYFIESELPYNISKAPNGEIAYKIIQKRKPDIIITDWEMPIMDGIELIKKIKAENNIKDIPVIMCTGVMTSAENLQTALNAGAIDYIRKPIDKIELIARTRSALILADSILKINKQNEDLKSLNGMKDRMFSIIAHDLRGPVGHVKHSLLLVSEFLENGDLAKVKAFLKLISEASESTFELLDKLLSWSRSQLNSIAIDPVVFDLKTIIAETFEILHPLAKAKGIKLEDKSHEDFFVFADKDMIKTVIRNLITNSIKFTSEAGLISVDVKYTNHDTIISVQDTGVGIEKERLSKLFDFAENESTPGTYGEKGTGLGLVLSHEFVRKNKGKLWVDSTLGQGSIFYVSLPHEANLGI